MTSNIRQSNVALQGILQNYHGACHLTNQKLKGNCEAGTGDRNDYECGQRLEGPRVVNKAGMALRAPDARRCLPLGPRDGRVLFQLFDNDLTLLAGARLEVVGSAGIEALRFGMDLESFRGYSD